MGMIKIANELRQLSFAGILICHTAAFFLGFILDILIGDPHSFPHPVRAMGALINCLETLLYRGKNKLFCGGVLVAIVIVVTVASTGALLFVAYLLHYSFGVVTESIMTWQALALKSLRTESIKVYKDIRDGDIEAARADVSMIVGRDTEHLDEQKIIKAAVETVAENTSDGVVAPMLCLALGGPILGFLYKAINTMDSMVGYKNDRYLYFGRCAAKSDDIVNFIPARIAAYLMIIAASIGGRNFDAKGAIRIYKRDRRKHESPNSAQTESVCAGALGIRLAGDASYFGRKVSKPCIGDTQRMVEAEDIKKTNRLLYITSILCFFICMALLLAVGLMAIEG